MRAKFPIDLKTPEEIHPRTSRAALHDFASWHSGATIIPELTTPPSKTDKRNGPVAVIDDDLNPGRCWVIDGSFGQIGIRLSGAISITHITVEHVDKDLVDTVITAPKTLLVWGIPKAYIFDWKDMGRMVSESGLTYGPGTSHPQFTFLLLASLRYDIASPNNRQTFLIKHPHVPMSFEGVVIEVLENWGGETTCLYGIRVHGFMATETVI
ncbi:hypothetical protein CVT26_002280 [Gymnopilus dilepis]|uniref:SUN domain-containing protein n=1 Tax=Gymnopilus dilepis TaxID=231916 RepID=A0A409X611_9AGAR|nr:hypothetical protein CVT26_002280 [Gymnopilus dilepis]